MKRFGEAVKARRLWLGLSQAEAARDAGISDTTWSSVEAGNQVSQRTMAGVTRALEWPGDAMWRIQNGEDLVEWGGIRSQPNVVDLMTALEESVRKAKEAKAVQLAEMRERLRREHLEPASVLRYDFDPDVDWYEIIHRAPDYVRRAIAELLEPFLEQWMEEQRSRGLRLAATEGNPSSDLGPTSDTHPGGADPE